MSLCKCGCGMLTPIAKKTVTKRNHKKGQPIDFIQGHWARIQPLVSIEDRLWSRINKLEDDDCWEWTGSFNHRGYGQISYHNKMVRTHRLVYELTHGPIPDGLHCLHKCDNRKCNNPNHLYLGTNKDNVDDRVNKNRSNRPTGEKNGRSKILDQDREDIKNSTLSGLELAKKYNLHPSRISKIKKDVLCKVTE